MGRFLVVLGGLGGSLGGLGRLLGHLGGVLEGLGGVLGGIGAVLGRLGSSWVVLRHFGAVDSRCAADLGVQKGAKMKPNFDPRRMKIDVENEVEKRRLLKIVLEPSWVDLGSSWVPSWGQNRALA